MYYRIKQLLNFFAMDARKMKSIYHWKRQGGGGEERGKPYNYQLRIIVCRLMVRYQWSQFSCTHVQVAIEGVLFFLWHKRRMPLFHWLSSSIKQKQPLFHHIDGFGNTDMGYRKEIRVISEQKMKLNSAKQ